jgi:NTP pyrophosphatase (non-canonical NTP hydrolase)
MNYAQEELMIFDGINQLVNSAHRAAVKAGWWTKLPLVDGEPIDLTLLARNDDFYGGLLVSQKLALIHSEISEAVEGHRKDLMDDKLPHRKMVEVELADAMIRIADLAGAMGLDLGGAMVEKMAYNVNREDHKPENRNAPGGKSY